MRTNAAGSASQLEKYAKPRRSYELAIATSAAILMRTSARLITTISGGTDTTRLKASSGNGSACTSRRKNRSNH